MAVDDVPTRGLDEGWPLVAREHEMATIRDDTGRPDAGGVLLTGPPGQGKSRLARAAIELAGQAGLPVARINGHTEAASIPLAAFAHLLPDDLHPNAAGMRIASEHLLAVIERQGSFSAAFP